MKILIIGAGICGLQAAKHLVEKDVECVIIEARDRIGGRIFTNNDLLGTPVESGAEFVHGNQPLTRALVKASGTSMTRCKGEMYSIYDNELRGTDTQAEGWQSLNKKLKSIRDDMSVKSFMDKYFFENKYRDLRYELFRFIEGYDAADPSMMSVLAYREEGADDEEQYRIKNSYRQLIQHLLSVVQEKNSIRTNCIAKTIRWRKGAVETETQEGEIIEADKIIITTQVNLIAGRTLQFSPALENYIEAAGEFGFGSVIKFFFDFSEKIWERSSRKLADLQFIFSDAKIPTWWSQGGESTIITGWLGGPSAAAISGNKDQQFDYALGSLSYLFQIPVSELEHQLKRWASADWLQDPFSRGAYAYPTVHTKKAKEILTTPVEDTLYFAGEALTPGKSMGTVEAALESAREVSLKILRTLTK